MIKLFTCRQLWWMSGSWDWSISCSGSSVECIRLWRGKVRPQTRNSLHLLFIVSARIILRSGKTIFSLSVVAMCMRSLDVMFTEMCSAPILTAAPGPSVPPTPSMTSSPTAWTLSLATAWTQRTRSFRWPLTARARWGWAPPPWSTILTWTPKRTTLTITTGTQYSLSMDLPFKHHYPLL